MKALTIKADITGLAESAEAVQRLRGALEDRRQIHAHLAGYGKEKLRTDISALPSHSTANRLGASPTQHLAKSARKIEGQSDDKEAVLLLPRASRLRAAFGSYTLTPGAGKKYLTIPAHASTYGKRAGEFAGGTFSFTPFGGAAGRFKALVFKDGANKGQVGYWLKTSVAIAEDTTLIPFDLLSQDLAKEATDYLDEVINGGEA